MSHSHLKIEQIEIKKVRKNTSGATLYLANKTIADMEKERERKRDKKKSRDGIQRRQILIAFDLLIFYCEGHFHITRESSLSEFTVAG